MTAIFPKVKASKNRLLSIISGSIYLWTNGNIRDGQSLTKTLYCVVLDLKFKAPWKANTCCLKRNWTGQAEYESSLIGRIQTFADLVSLRISVWTLLNTATLIFDHLLITFWWFCTAKIGLPETEK